MRPNNFDLVRLLAALQVVVFHGVHHLELASLENTWFTRILDCFPGVPIFFVISGFLVSASFERSKTLTSYTINRSLRIFPGLWVCLLFSILTVVCLKPEIFVACNVTELFAWLAAQMTMFQFFNPEFLRSYGVGVLNGSLWTIPVELQFYMATPVVYYLFANKNRLNLKTMLILLIVFLAFNQILFVFLKPYSESIWFKLTSCSMVPHFWLFILGIIIQQNFVTVRPFFEGKLVCWIIAHAAAVTVVSYFGLPFGSNQPFPLVALTLAGTTLAFAYTGRSVADKILRHNDISYGVYIYHMIVVNAFIELGFVGKTEHLVYLIFATVVLSSLSWKFIESPCMKLKKRWQTTLPS